MRCAKCGKGALSVAVRPMGSKLWLCLDCLKPEDCPSVAVGVARVIAKCDIREKRKNENRNKKKRDVSEVG